MLVEKGALHSALRHLLSVADRNTTALGQARLHADGRVLRISATCGTTALSVTVPAEGALSACLPLRALMSFVKPDSSTDRKSLVELKPVDGEQMVVAMDGAMTTLSMLEEVSPTPDTQPAPGEWTTRATWDVAWFRRTMAWVLLAAGSDETRKQLTGVYFGHGEVVACDGHRLHLAPVEPITGLPTLVAGKAISVLLRVLPRSGRITVTRAGDLLRFTIGDWQLETAAITDVEFPPYKRVVPAPGTEQFTAVLERDRLVAALAGLAKRDARSRGVRTVWNGGLSIEREDEAGKTRRTVPFFSTTHTGEDLVAGFDARYLSDAVSAGAERVTARLGGPLDPICVEIGDGAFAVVMPMRI